MLKKIFVTSLFLSLFFISMVIFGAIVNHVSTNGPYSNNILFQICFKISQIPSNIKTYYFGGDLSIKKRDKIKILEKKKYGLKKFKKITNQEYILISKYFLDQKKFRLELFDINNNIKIHEWVLKNNGNNKLKPGHESEDAPRRYTFEHSLMLNNGNILISSGGLNVKKLDVCSNILWESQIKSHHSKELDHLNNLWVPVYLQPKLFQGKEILHDGIVNIDINNGKKIFQKSLLEIFNENNLNDYIANAYSGKDPLHLNDIQPVLENGKFWKQGDLFLSLRNISMILLYRPSNNRVIWFKTGPWRHQHDVDILDDRKITIFNNNTDISLKTVNENNNIIVYDFENNNASLLIGEAFKKYKIDTYYEGLHEVVKNQLIFVEEQDQGKLYKFNYIGELEWIYTWDAQVKWSRLYNNFINKNWDLEDTIKKIKNTKCN